MSIRREIVELDIKTMSLTVKEFCRRHGISTWFFYDLRRRYVAEGERALAPKSRAPKVVANRISPDLEDKVALARKELTDLGLDVGPASIFDRLVDQGEHPPSEATIYRALRRRGLIVDQPKKAPKRTARRFVAARVNECWQIDATHVQLAGGGVVEVINVVDDRSRLLVASVAVKTCTAAAAFDVLVAASVSFGLPERVLSDNGQAFVVLAAPLTALGVATVRSRAHHPQTCGKVERFHQTLKQRLAARRRARTVAALQAELDEFRDYYNHHRRHRGIDRRIPYEVWSTDPRSGPADRPLADTVATHVTRTTPTDGRVWISKTIVVSVGGAYNHRPVTAIRTGDHVDLFTEGRHIRSVTIKPGVVRYPLT